MAQPGIGEPPGPWITGQTLSKWTWLGPFVFAAVEVTGSVVNPGAGGFDLIVDAPFSYFLRYVASHDPDHEPLILHCETYPINPPTDPNNVTSNSYWPWAMPDVQGLKDPLIGTVWDFSGPQPTPRPMKGGDRVRVRGQLRIENGHPLSNGQPENDGGTGWGFMELHPYDWRNVWLDQGPRPGHVPVIAVLGTAPLYAYVLDGGLTATSARVGIQEGGGLFYNQVTTGAIPIGGKQNIRETVVRNTTGKDLDSVRTVGGGGEIAFLTVTIDAPPTTKFGGTASVVCADVDQQKSLLIEYHTSPDPIIGGYLRHSIRGADGTWQPVGDVNGQIGDPGWIDELCAVSSDANVVSYPLLTDTARTAYIGRQNSGQWIPIHLGGASGPFNGGEIPIAYPGRLSKFAGASPGQDQELYLIATADGHLWQTGQNISKNWQDITELTDQLGIPGHALAIAGTSSAPGTLQFAVASDSGHVWHTIAQLVKPNWWVTSGGFQWQPAGDATDQFDPTGAAGVIVAVAAVSAAPNDVQFLLVNHEGEMFYTERAPNGTWLNIRTLPAGMPRNVIDVGAASATPGEAQFYIVTEDGHLWHTIHHSQSDSWDPIGDASQAMGLTEPVTRVAAAPSPGVPGEVQCILVTAQQGSGG